MKHQYRILTVAPNVHNLSAPMTLKMAELLLSNTFLLDSDDLKRYIIVEEASKK